PVPADVSIGSVRAKRGVDMRVSGIRPYGAVAREPLLRLRIVQGLDVRKPVRLDGRPIAAVRCQKRVEVLLSCTASWLALAVHGPLLPQELLVLGQHNHVLMTYGKELRVVLPVSIPHEACEFVLASVLEVYELAQVGELDV